MENTITKGDAGLLMLRLGATPGLFGFTSLRDAVEFVHNTPGHVPAMQMYAAAAAASGTTPSRCERNIRHMVSLIHKTPGPLYRELAEFAGAARLKAMPNHQFICTVVEWIRIRRERVTPDMVREIVEGTELGRVANG